MMTRTDQCVMTGVVAAVWGLGGALIMSQGDYVCGAFLLFCGSMIGWGCWVKPA